MIPKGDVVTIADKMYGRIDKTRTLTVGNTDARIYALGLNWPLSQACAAAISTDQRGFVSGRSILASVALCEAAMAEVAPVSVEAAGVFLDFANAFPTLSRRWLSLVLRKAKVPAQFIRAVEFLYEGLESMFVFGGEVVAVIGMRCRVKQGCPLSGSLFALCVDALLRRISCIPGRRRRVFAYADDLAVILRRLFDELPALLLLLARWGRATGLVLRLTKSVIVWLGGGPPLEAQRRLHNQVPDSLGIEVEDKAKYLGVYVGPGAESVQWDAVLGRMLSRASEVSRSGRSLRTRVIMHRIYVSSLAAYKLQFVEPTSALVHVHRRSVQRLTGAPWMALNMDVMESLMELGFGVAVPRLGDLATASPARAAHSERGTVEEGCRWLAEAGTSDDALLVPPQRLFCSKLVVLRWRRALADIAVDRMAGGGHAGRGLHRTLLRRLFCDRLEERRAALETTLRRRLARWSLGHVEALGEGIRSAMISATPEELRVSLLKTVLYGWCTASRFGLPGRGCLYDCGGGADEQSHYLVCSRAEVVRAVVLLHALRGDDILRLRILLVFDCLLFAFDARRIGSPASARQLVLALLKELRRRHPGIRDLGLRACALPAANA